MTVGPGVNHMCGMHLYEVPMFLLDFGMGIIFANFHVRGMILYEILRLCVLGA